MEICQVKVNLTANTNSNDSDQHVHSQSNQVLYCWALQLSTSKDPVSKQLGPATYALMCMLFASNHYQYMLQDAFLHGQHNYNEVAWIGSGKGGEIDTGKLIQNVTSLPELCSFIQSFSDLNHLIVHYNNFHKI